MFKCDRSDKSKYLQQCDIIEILHMLHESTSISNSAENIYFRVQYVLHELFLPSHLSTRLKSMHNHTVKYDQEAE